MASLKELRGRIASVKSTQRITSAMKMVAGAKLARAQEKAEAARPYADRMERMLTSVAAGVAQSAGGAKMLTGTGSDQTHLLLLITSDRGLCGAFNSTIARFARQRISALRADNKGVKLLIVGRKGYGQMRRDHDNLIIDTIEDIAKPAPTFDGAAGIGHRLTGMYEDGAFDVCTVIYNKFQSALTQIVTPAQLIPFAQGAVDGGGAEAGEAEAANGGVNGSYEFEPEEAGILDKLLPRNLSVQVYRALLESFASEQGARMTAMDSATRNAGDMIDKLSLIYNRTRQAEITRELIEIISGAEAV